MHRHELAFEEGDDFGEQVIPDDETTVENVLAALEKYDQQLKESGMIDDATLKTQAFDIDETAELDKVSREALAHTLRSVWGRLGMRDAHNVIAERLERLDPELLTELDEHRAECIYFDTAEKSWKKLGSEPVTSARVLAQLQPPNKPSQPAKGVNLAELQEVQGRKAANLLIGIKINSDQLLGWAMGSPAKKQNLIRLAFVLREEPSLCDMRKYLKGMHEEERPEVLTIEEVLDRSVAEIAAHMQNYMFERSEKGSASAWEPIDYEQYNRTMQYAYYSLQLIDRIRKDMQVE